ncbi:protein NASP homolog [Drosophila grimshawi]|uniref:GH18579 n=1 Tax=Drosophila grimshawi TaxID=7222 RepID=B4JHY8_DROGR|nr:protein NASP homolog [Drosophila grimshawi]EDV92896.1 GH18579 [Drosophila grimshawi]
MSAEAEAIVTTAAADATSEKTVVEPVAADTTPDDAPSEQGASGGKAEQERAEKILKGKELFSLGSRNFLVKSYDEAADELSQVCQLYEEVYGELADELGQPLLLYAKSLIAMALDENKVIDVPDEAADDDEDVDDDEDDEDEKGDANGEKPALAKAANGATNGEKLHTIKEGVADEADSTGDAGQSKDDEAAGSSKPPTGVDEVSSSNGNATATTSNDDERPSTSNGEVTASTSNGAAAASMDVDQAEEDTEEGEGVAGSLQLAWEILEAAAKIFSRQGLSGLTYLADVQTELANIEFENGILDAAREDYEKALKIHAELPSQNRRALAELHYKIGLTYLMQQLNKEGAAALRNSSVLIEEEIAEIKNKANPSEREKNNMLDLEETKQEILVKIQEIEDTQAQTIAEVRAALDSYIKPMGSSSSKSVVDAAASSSTAAATAVNGAASSSSSSTASSVAAASSSAISSSSAKPTDITHLIKRKKPEEPSSEAEALCSPAKRAAV